MEQPNQSDAVPEDTLTLAELMFHAEQFCVRVEAALADAPPALEDRDELRLKLGQCHNLLAELQTMFEKDELTIENAAVRGTFRYLVMALLWVAFRARHAMNFRLYRMVVMVESGFTHLLVSRR